MCAQRVARARHTRAHRPHYTPAFRFCLPPHCRHECTHFSPRTTSSKTHTVAAFCISYTNVTRLRCRSVKQARDAPNTFQEAALLRIKAQRLSVRFGQRILSFQFEQQTAARPFPCRMLARRLSWTPGNSTSHRRGCPTINK